MDALLSKNQALCEMLYIGKLNIADALNGSIFIFIKSHEKGLITKEHTCSNTYTFKFCF